jgi:4-amino-4-deoxy-L-arabinose transferase-like glycosyltransferase
LSAWWYLALWGQIGSEKFFKLLKFEILGRLSGDVHNEPYAFYLYVFPAIFFPWSIALVSAVGCAWRKVDVPMPLGAGDGEETVRSRRVLSDAFLVAWLIGVVLFFTVPKAKLATYVLPAFPAAALLTARFLRRLGSAQEPVQRGWAMLTALLGGAIALGLTSLPLFQGMFKQDAQETIQSLPVPLWTIGLGVGLMTGVPWIVAGVTRRCRVVLFALPAFIVLLVAVALPVVFERSEFLNTSRVLSSAPEVQTYARNAKVVYSIGWPEESLVWYTRNGVHGILKPDRDPKVKLTKAKLTELLQEALDEHPPGTVLIFAHREKLKRWFDPGELVRVREVAGNGRLAVLVNEGTQR